MTDMDSLEISYQYTPEFAEAVARRLLKRWGRYYSWALALLAVMTLPAIAHHVVFGQIGWLDCAFTALMATIVIYLWNIRANVLSRAVARARRLPDPRVSIRFGAERIAFQTADTSSTLTWNRLSKVEEGPSFWLLYFGDDNPVPIPTKVLPEGLRERIEAIVREHGGVIRSV
jgi:YcxB-like protein